MRQVRRGNGRASIGYLDDGMLAFALCAHDDASIGFGVLARIVNENAKHALNVASHAADEHVS